MGSEYSTSLGYNIGILTGVGTSLSIRDFFGSDFCPRPHPSDVRFAKRHILNIERADDSVLWSTSPAGIQMHCNDWPLGKPKKVTD
ncbi:hypothetical protein DFS33DRAFT_171215 [Desarmillaria ectypa]|nr:hypothetical protein DFS33DRAFT_171215 [Desarmillaria ectypa]